MIQTHIYKPKLLYKPTFTNLSAWVLQVYALQGRIYNDNLFLIGYSRLSVL